MFSNVFPARALKVLMLALAMPAAADPLDALVFERESCYTGNYADAESFVRSMQSRMPNVDAAHAERMRHYYNRLRSSASCETFSYEVDGLSVRGFLAHPREAGEERLPVIIFNRGGNADTGEIPFKYIIGKLYPLVEAGFVVIGSQYRGASRNGEPHPDRLADEFGGRDVNDVLALLPVVDTLPFADSQRIGMWGQSRGGMMAFLAARETDRISVLVAEAAPTDLEAELAFRPAMEQVMETWIPAYAANREQALRDRSVLRWLDELPPDLPILILHGTHDRRVSPNSALNLASRLQELERPYQLVMYEGGSHALHRGHDLKVRREVIEWFTDKLVDKDSAKQQ